MDFPAEAARLHFRKSSYSFKENCVEVADRPGFGVAVRDSEDAAAGHLDFSGSAWAALVGLVKADGGGA
ncbi:DUF397 domain-containing protein [Streptomonospora wellingtoniae]|uniref:DUF397 domain-containing protein n=1 Tax=Streptomonospora wellingtoniae TaxID=3075544 RepID=A0ABU2KSH5_9ACTN|nr:DUF397 domain-containing protein [Streptomonospora sp. DSM 45055]MDT0302229.1 DUF397 domain-containing protein [Streptomonospora sp. DSM 45055]